jgi:membrane protease YdiL (CAAX protease family)
MTEIPVLAAPISEPERINQAFAGVGAALGLVVWFYAFTFPLGLASSIVTRSHPRFGLFLGFLAMLMVVPGALWVATSAWGKQWRKAVPLASVGPGVLVWTSLCVLTFIPLVVAWALALDRTIGLPVLPNPLSSIGVLGLVFGAPIAEEVLCRGYGLARIRELAGDRRALLYTALVFALLHGSWVKLPGTFTIGLFLGWLVLRTGSLWPALLGHVTNNGAVFVLSRLGPDPSLDAKHAPWSLILTLVAASLACLALLWSPQVRGRISGLNAST